MRSIDWLTIRQRYPEGTIPELTSGWVFSVDSEGEPEWQVTRHFEHFGSYDTRVRVRASGGMVEWSGNPSRFGRPDNVWGFTAMADVLACVVNPQLRELGLPPMTSAPGDGFESVRSGGVIRSYESGAQVTRVDLARMFSTGGPRNLSLMLRALSNAAHRGKDVEDRGTSISYGSRRHQRDTWYCKATELQRHLRRCIDDDDREYRGWLVEFLQAQGALRHEKKLGRDALRRLGLRPLGKYDDAQANEYVDRKMREILPEVGAGGLEDIANQLQQFGYAPRTAQQAQGLAYQYVSGVNVWDTMSRPTAYRYRKILRTVGIDIRRPQRDVRSMRLRVETVHLAELQPPEWYRAAA